MCPILRVAGSAVARPLGAKPGSARAFGTYLYALSGIENPSDLFTKSVDAPTQRHLGPMISGKVLLNPVSLPLNALTKKEPKVAYKRKSKM